ncbi:YdbL family protein [Sphingomonas sp. PAMC 26617]|uniref:YdbL family protein n=1 Tax=Sphingomonas sp. PAMC 26617 TaxID=1112216 RepID=UPI0002DF1C04|nr:YdbL family protein [Sphingomonas sp. PAMC 26617]
MRTWKMAAMLAAAVLLGTAGVALAQDDWKAARAAGQIGEQPDGYLGVVGASTPALSALVAHVNIQRKAVYTREAAANNATVEDFAFTSGCNLIAKTSPGDKYRAPGGAWKTRGAGAPERDSRCL